MLILLSFRSHRIFQEILIRQTDAVFELGLVGPSQLSGFAHVQELAGGAVGTGGVPQDFSLKAYHLGHQFGEGLNGELLAGAGIHGFVTGVVVHQKHTEVGKVVHIQELAQG